MTKRLDELTEEIVGVKCRHCAEIVIDELLARQLAGVGLGAAIPITIIARGGMHLLVCKKPKSN